MNKPDFIIAGAAKSGTTSLIKYLSYSNEVFCLTTLKNGHEVNFFSKNFKKGYKWYSSLFSSFSKNQIIGEKSVSYMENKQAPERILEFCPNVNLFLF